MNIRTIIAKNYINFRGWKTNRKIVVVESDDWGSVRIANQKVVEQAIKINSSVAKNKFLSYDGLEKQTDLEYLFEMLSSLKDYKGNHPVITALALTSNPDFEAMKMTEGFIEYKSECITDTYQKYGENQLFSLWNDSGIKNNLLYPQFHGKEHLFVNRYLKRINNPDDIENFAFQNDSIFGVENTTRALNFLAALEYHNEEEKKTIENQTEQGLESFNELFGFYSKSFCPSQSIYGEHIYPILKSKGIITLQAGQQFVPNNLQLIKVDNLWGQRTMENLIFTRRNCTFEPYKGGSLNHVDECLKEIEIAFKWGKPAVINSHRVNFTSRLRTDLRDQTLINLKRMITEILKKWPDVEFVNSAQLAEIMLENKS